MKEQAPVPLAKDFEKLKAKLTNPQNGSQKPKEKDLIAPLIGSEVYLILRNGQSLTGLLMKVTKFEVFVQTDVERLIIMKHAVDVIKAVENGKAEEKACSKECKHS